MGTKKGLPVFPFHCGAILPHPPRVAGNKFNFLHLRPPCPNLERRLAISKLIFRFIASPSCATPAKTHEVCRIISAHKKPASGSRGRVGMVGTTVFNPKNPIASLHCIPEQ
jgi:hypothetical protein